MGYTVITPDKIGDVAFYKILLFGESGTGKTWAASSASNPLCLVTEANALATLKLSLKAHGHKKAAIVHAHGKDAMATIRAVLIDAKSGKLLEQGYDTLMIDGLTDIQKIIKADICGPGADTTTLPQYATLTERMRRFFRTVRDIKMDVVCTALSDDDKDELNGIRYVFPLFQGRKLRNEVLGFFNIAGYMFKRDAGAGAARWNKKDSDGSGVERLAVLDGPEGTLSKGCGAIGGIMEPDLARWVGILRGTIKIETEPTPDAAQADGE